VTSLCIQFLVYGWDNQYGQMIYVTDEKYPYLALIGGKNEHSFSPVVMGLSGKFRKCFWGHGSFAWR